MAGPEPVRPNLILERWDECLAHRVAQIERVRNDVLEGSTSSRMKRSAQSSFSWYSGSVSKSHTLASFGVGRGVRFLATLATAQYYAHYSHESRPRHATA